MELEWLFINRMDTKKYYREYYKKNKKKIIKRQKEYYNNLDNKIKRERLKKSKEWLENQDYKEDPINGEKLKYSSYSAKKYQYRKKYNLSFLELVKIAEEQEYKCKICKIKPT